VIASLVLLTDLNDCCHGDPHRSVVGSLENIELLEFLFYSVEVRADPVMNVLDRLTDIIKPFLLAVDHWNVDVIV
jgi:hypothetical protein